MATKSVEEMKDSMWQNLSEKTGKDRATWVGLAGATGIVKHRELINHLKVEYGITHGYANAIALATVSPEPDLPLGSDDQIAVLFTGSKAALRPIYDALAAAIDGFGDDIEYSPKKNYVSVRRRKQFAILQPAAGRVDVGLVLKSVQPENRLEASGSFNAMLTHRVRVASITDVDDELTRWMRQAYDEG